jgi:hypothetical protein
MSQSSHDRQRKKAGQGGGAREGAEGVGRHVQQAQRLQQARRALVDNARNAASYEADPQGYLRRYGVQHGVTAEEAADPAGTAQAAAGLVVGASPIHGKGVFSEKGITKGSVVCAVVAGDTITDTAARVNAADVPNTAMEVEGGRLVLRATEDLAPGREVVANYPVDGDWTRHRGG